MQPVVRKKRTWLNLEDIRWGAASPGHLRVRTFENTLTGAMSADASQARETTTATTADMFWSQSRLSATNRIQHSRGVDGGTLSEGRNDGSEDDEESHGGLL